MSKIVIIEDDPMIAEIYAKKFGDAGFEVFSASTGEEALNLAKKEQVDVVMSDLIMPKMDGFEVIQRLRSGAYSPNLKIIIASNLSQKEDHDKALQLGANGFVAKSDFSPSELVSEVKRLLGQYVQQEKNLNREDDASVKTPVDAKKILMIEDEEIIIEMFGDKLKQDGFEVTIARNGAWGVKEALKQDFDLLIVDMVVTAMTGSEIVAKLKLEDKTKNLPIIVLSASVDAEAQREVEEMGVHEFVVKTQITPSELSNKVEKLLK